MSNRERFERAVHSADQLANGGLNEAQQQYFVENIRDQTGLQSAGVRVEILKGGTYEIPKGTLADRVAIPKSHARNPLFRRTVSPSHIKLNPVDIVVPVEIEDKMLRDAVGDKDVTEKTIMDMFAKQAANNVEMLAWNGFTTGPAKLESEMVDGGSASRYLLDVYYQLLDGIFKQAEAAASVDVGNADLDDSWIAKALIQLPDKYQEDISKLRLLLSKAHNTKFLNTIGARGTPLGDAAVSGRAFIEPYGVRMVPLSLLHRNPIFVENVAAKSDGFSASSLSYSPVSDLVLTPNTLDINGHAGYILGTDYTQSLSAGTWTRLGSAGISANESVKCTYRTRGKAILTDPMNIVLGIVQDNVKILKDREIFGDVHQYAIHMSLDVKILWIDAMVLLKNIANPV